MPNRVLVCDDERDIASVIVAMLEDLGLDAWFETNPHSAIKRVTSEHFDLVTLDFMMPELDGRATMDLMSKIRPELKFVIISGLEATDPRLQELHKHAPAVQILNKPFGLTDLVAALAAVGLHAG